MIALRRNRRLKTQGFRAGQRVGLNIHVCSWDVAKLLQNIESKREIRSRESETHFAVSPVEDFDRGLV